MKQIKVICSKKGCPRKKTINREDTDPPLATTMKISCPWHDDGDFETPLYYDKDGNEIIYEG